MKVTGRGAPPPYSLSMLWLITPANGSPPDGLMCMEWMGYDDTPPSPPLFHGISDERILDQSCAPCTAVIIIFIDEYHRRQDDEVAICAGRLSHANTERGLCRGCEIWSCTDLDPLHLFWRLRSHTSSCKISNIYFMSKFLWPREFAWNLNPNILNMKSLGTWHSVRPVFV